MSEAALEKALLDAHASDNRRALAMLYEAAADRLAARAKSDPEAGSREPPDRISDAEAFFLVQAYVFALQSGIDRAQVLKTRLIAAGRDA